MCQTTEAADRLLQLAFERFGFSARTYSRVLKVARTIADLEGSEKIDSSHAAGGGAVPHPGQEILAAKIGAKKPPPPGMERAALRFSKSSLLPAVVLLALLGKWKP